MNEALEIFPTESVARWINKKTQQLVTILDYHPGNNTYLVLPWRRNVEKTVPADELYPA